MTDPAAAMRSGSQPSGSHRRRVVRLLAIAAALIQRAIDSGQVRLLYAHTLPTPNPSTRILTKHGFAQVGVAHDEDEGLVWRWERRVNRQ